MRCSSRRRTGCSNAAHLNGLTRPAVSPAGRFSLATALEHRVRAADDPCMSIPRFYQPSLEGERLTITGREAHHAVRVRRLAVGDEVEVFDGRGGEVRGSIVSARTDRLEIAIVERRLSRSLPASLIVAAAIPKGDRADWMVEKLAELATTMLVPLIAARSVVRPSVARIERWRRKCVETAKQCGANIPMSVVQPVPVAALPAMFTQQQRIFVADPDSRRPSYQECLNNSGSDSAFVIVGPEGGLTNDELKRLTDAGASCVRLAVTMLRIETAAVAMAAVWAMRNSERSDDGR